MSKQAHQKSKFFIISLQVLIPILVDTFFVISCFSYFQVHEGIKDFKCELCPYATATGKELRNHITVVHEKRKDYNCDTCGKLFGDSGYLSTHIKTVHGNTRDYNCKYCPRDFKTLSSKKEHEQVCPNNKQKVYYNCKTCGKTFMQTRTLATHIR